VHRRSPLVRLLIGLGLVCGCLLVLAGGLALRGPGLIAVGAAGVLAACLAAGMAHENPDRDRWAMMDAAVFALGCTVVCLLVLCGTGALFGTPVAAGLVGVSAVVGVVVFLRGRAGAPRPTTQAAPSATFPAPLPSWPSSSAEPPARREQVLAEPARLLPPVDQLSTRALGREWLRTTAALASRLEPVARASIVRRREDALDELERRDPVGFARWLAAGPVPGSDPADWVHSDSAGSTEAA
jgi:hypothetical protein